MKKEEIVLLRLNHNDTFFSMVLCFSLLSGASLLSLSDKIFHNLKAERVSSHD